MNTSNVLVETKNINGNLVPAVTSLNVAEVFGKRHGNIIRDIEALFTQVPEIFIKLNFECYEYPATTGIGATRFVKAYLLSKDGFTLLAMGYTGEKAMAFKIAYINKFNEMEKQLQDHTIPPELDTRFKVATMFADRLYEDKNQQILFLDKYIKAKTGESLLELTGTQLSAPTQRQIFTPTEIGKWYDVSSQAINTFLAKSQLQNKINGKWEPTPLGTKYGAILLDTGKAHSDGTPIRQLKWDSRIKEFLDQNLDKLKRKLSN